MPINLPNGNDVEQIVLPNGANASEVYGPNGNLVWEGTAIPDSEADQKLLHRWYLDDVDTGTTVDSVGSADGSVNGVSSVSGDWVGGSAGDGDGTDDVIPTTSLGSFAGNMDQGDFAVAFSMQTTATDWITGVEESGQATLYAPWIRSGGEILIRVDSGEQVGDERVDVETASAFNDGNPYRVVLNVTGTSASDVGIWTNQTEETTNTNFSGTITDTQDWTVDFPLYARNSDGSFDFYANTILDDYCLFGSSLTSSEIQSYTNPWS